ncbi:pVIII [Duck adenovirus 2]|uniref:Pre-hexon-linking protein VIII n=1 Tax=Duck adenovirus 2 TaxID=1520006 RepID=A0A075FAQ0_9ADEN|nr:pVIII [Duck adenovirus 2]AIE77228.1 pVIII [Duck adenovirus 2]
MQLSSSICGKPSNPAFFIPEMLRATPTEYVWKYNPLFGTPAGAQQNYGSTVDWVVPGGRVMYAPIQSLRSSVPSPDQFTAMTKKFEAMSDQQPYANAHQSAMIAANVADSGVVKSGLRPIDYGTRQRVQLAGGAIPLYTSGSEGDVQLSGGMTEGRVQLSGGLHARRHTIKPPRWCGTEMTGNGLGDPEEVASESLKYHLRTQGPAVTDMPDAYTQRAFMESHVPVVVPRPFRSQDPADFPANFSAIYKGRTAFENTFWDW